MVLGGRASNSVLLLIGQTRSLVALMLLKVIMYCFISKPGQKLEFLL